MSNTTKALDEDFNDIIGRPHVKYYEDIKPASSEKQKAFNILNKWQGKKHYLLALKIEQDKLKGLITD